MKQLNPYQTMKKMRFGTSSFHPFQRDMKKPCKIASPFPLSGELFGLQ